MAAKLWKVHRTAVTDFEPRHFQVPEKFFISWEVFLVKICDPFSNAVAILYTEKSYQIQLKSDCIYHAPIDLEQQIGRPFGSKSIGAC